MTSITTTTTETVTIVSKPEDIVKSLKYLKNCEIYKHLPPYILGCKVDEKFPFTNTVFEDGPPEKIRDIRGLDSTVFDLNTFGFWKVEHKFGVTDLDTESVSKAGGYLDELKEVVKASLESKGFSVEEVGSINWVYRSSMIPDEFTNEDYSGVDSDPHPPYPYIHSDCTYQSGLKRVRTILGNKADEVLREKRVLLLNCWKPVNVVEDCNLAVCDARTVAYDKCIHGKFILNMDYTSDSNFTGYSPGQRWYYVSHQRPDEVMLFKQFDTDQTGEARYVPHGSFWQNDPKQCKVPRESVEVRLWVILAK